MIVVASPQWAEDQLRRGALSCPHCAGPLRPYGHARIRAVRGLGTATLTAKPRRARCTDCRATQVLLPATMTCRRADSTEVIGHALAAKAAGAGFRTIASVLGRPPSTVRAWLRRATPRHAAWLYEQALLHCRQLDVELLVRPAPQPSLLGRALNLLAGAALRHRERFAHDDPPSAWALISCMSNGHLLAPPLKT